MNTIKFINGLAANMLLALLFAFVFHASPVVALCAFVLLYCAGVAMYVARKQSGGRLAFEGLAAEAWIPLVLEDFYPNNSFMQAAFDMSPMVDNDKINFAEAGGDPDVLVDNDVYPIAMTDVSEIPKDVVLKTYDTTSTVIRNARAVEYVYDQKLLHVNKHKKALAKKIGIDAAYSYAPTAHDISKYNTVLNLGGSDSILDAIIDLRAAYTAVDADMSDLNLVLCSDHEAAILKEDKILYKAIMAASSKELYGFKLWFYSQLPVYIAGTQTKAAKGVAFDDGIHKRASISFMGSEVMKANGTVEMFSTIKDPGAKGDIFNFQMRALANTLRGKYAGAILK